MSSSKVKFKEFNHKHTIDGRKR